MPDVAGTTNYPASLDTDFTLLPVRDLESTTLNAPGVTSSSTVFPVIDTTGWPSAGFFTIEGEHCSYTGKTLTSYTGCSRGLFQSLGGVAPAAHATAATINLLVIAATHQVQNDAIRAIETKVGVGASTPTNAKYLKGGATPGTSAWGDITSGEIAAALGFTPAPGITVQVGRCHPHQQRPHPGPRLGLPHRDGVAHGRGQHHLGRPTDPLDEHPGAGGRCRHAPGGQGHRVHRLGHDRHRGR
jgi:hypothetical protein